MGSDFTTSLRPALVMTVLFALLLGLAYPLALTGIGQVVFPSQANGSLIRENGKVIGSKVIGQAFTGAGYFQTRPSAAGSAGYDGLASSGSNLGPASQALADRVKGDVEKRRAEGMRGPLPADLVTASGSGLDPHLSPEAALAQVPRIAKVRSMPESRIRGLVERSLENPILGVIGERRVNILDLNRQLDRLGGKPAG